MNEEHDMEFAGTCRGCGSNVDKYTEDGDTTYRCDNPKCEYHDGEVSDSEPEWMD